MTAKFQLFAGALAGVLVCSTAGAQVRDAASSVRQPTAHVRQHAARAAATSTGNGATGAQASQQASVIQIPPSGRMTTGFAPAANSFFSFDGSSGVPGLGFDFPHLAAISRAQGRDPFAHFGRDGHRGQGFFVPILFGGYPYYADDLGLDQMERQPEQQPERPAQPQPQVIVIQLPASSQQGTDSGNDPGNLSASAPASQAEAPIPDIGDFIFVRRDGRILFASLFSVVGTQLQYVTPEGIRRTLALSDLDANATQQMNEARGTTVQIHN